METVSPEMLSLLTDAEFADNVAVTIGVNLLQVIQEAAALAYEHEQTAARSVILLVGLEMLRQLSDALRKDGDLNLWTPGV